MFHTRLIWLVVILFVLTGCGGGGGGNSNDGGGGGSTASSDNGGVVGPGSDSSNNAPVADAGRQQNVEAGAKVRLDGSRSSDAEGDRLAYEWTLASRPSGSQAKLQNADTATPLFTADVAGSYLAKLVVNDGNGFSGADTVTVVASSNNSAPVADAGRMQNVQTSTVVLLDGSGSTDANGQSLNYQWSFVSRATGSAAQLANADTAAPSFTADAAGDYVARLVVSDGQTESAPARVTIHAAAANVAPVADAGGDRGVGVGDTVTLDGSGSRDADGDALRYDWQLVSVPQGSGATLDRAKTAKPSFVADAEGPYVAEVTVADDNGASASDRVVITAGANLNLSADLGNNGTYQTVEPPYNEMYGQTVVHEPNTAEDSTHGFALGRFKVTAVGGDITLNLAFDVNVLNGATGAYTLAFDGFQGYNTGTRQIRIPEGETVAFTVNVGIPQMSKAIVTYDFTVVETGDTFRASYRVESNDN